MAVAEEVARLFPVPFVSIVRFEADGAATEAAAVSPDREQSSTGARWNLEGRNVLRSVQAHREPARVEDHAALEGEVAAAFSRRGFRSTVGVPVAIAEKLWGAIVVSTQEGDLPPDTEQRLRGLADLVATVIAHAEAQRRLEQVGAEQAALRRVATLVAQGVPPAEIFAAVSREVGQLFETDMAAVGWFDRTGPALVVAGLAKTFPGVAVGSRWELDDSMTVSLVYRSGRSARLDAVDWPSVAVPIGEVGGRLRATSGVSSPIIVEGRLWGAITITAHEPLPPDAEDRLEKFTALIAAAIANAESRRELGRLADEQAALRRVAELVAREAPQAEIFAAIAAEIGQLLGIDEMRMMRYERQAEAVVVAAAGASDEVFPPGSQWPLEGDSVASRVFRTRQTARIDEYRHAGGRIAEAVRAGSIRAVVGAPILVHGRLWGAMLTGTLADEPLPPDTESRLSQFTELLAIAIGNTESRARADRLTAEQAALRRVATLVARRSDPEDVFVKVCEEVGLLLGAEAGLIDRFDGDGFCTTVGSWGKLREAFEVGTRWKIEGSGGASEQVYRTGRAVRLDRYAGSGSIAAEARRVGLRSAIASPIVVNGRVWASLVVATPEAEPLPIDAEARLARFAELVATAVADADSRREVARLAEEQAALRRVAMLVAEGASPGEVFDAVALEMAALLKADGIALCRYESDDEVSVLAHRWPASLQMAPGTRVRHDGASVSATVRRTHRPARMESYAASGGHIGAVLHDLRFRAGVGAPIVVDGRLWGVTIANWIGDEAPPSDTEERMAKFAQLLDTAIANADSRDQLAASRARLVSTADDARRRLVRDLHDGVQQRLVHTIVTLKLARHALRKGADQVESLFDEALDQAERANAELRELAHGILPSALTSGGLRAGVGTVVTRIDLPVEVDVPNERFPPEIEASAYFIVAEAMTNVVKHSQAGQASIRGFVDDETLHVQIRDDGRGGATAEVGHGLVGMSDRVTALGGSLSVDSPVGGGTLVTATLPLRHRATAP